MTNNDEWGKRLHDGLHDHLRGMESTMSMNQVKDQARKVRRNRSLAAGGAALAVLAVIVPTALLAQGNDHAAPLPATQSPSTSTPTSPSTSPSDPQSPTDSPSSGAGGPVVLSGRPRGSAPALAVLTNGGKQLGLPDGSSLPLPTKMWSVARAGDRYLALGASGTDAWSPVYLIAADGTVTRTGDQASSLASNGSDAAYATIDGEVMTYWSDGNVSMGKPEKGQHINVEGIVGNGSCYEKDGGCVVFYEGGSHGIGLADSHGIVDAAAPGAIALGGVVRTSDGWLVASQTSYSNTGSCWQVTDAGGQRLWKTCEYALYGFSPDAKYVLADPSYRDGAGAGKLYVLDAETGRVVNEFAAASRGFLATPPQWEDGTHALIAGFHQGDWELFRIGVDRSAEQVLGPVTGVSDGNSPWRVALQ